MALHTSPTTADKAFQRAEGVGEDRPHRSSRRPPAWFKLLVLGFHMPAIPVLRGRSYRRHGAASKAVALDELDEVDWGCTSATKSERQTPGDWVFPGCFLCTAVAALPLIGLRWTTPEGMATWNAFADALMFALPVMVPLPFLFLGCLGMLVMRPASRTPPALGFLGAAIAMGLAGLYALAA